MGLGIFLSTAMEMFEMLFDFREFFLAIIGFAIFQICAYVLASHAQQHSKFFQLISIITNFFDC